MKKLNSFILSLLIMSPGFVAPAWSQQVPETCEWQSGLDLGGCVFAIEGQYLFAMDNLGLPPRGFTFENCYTFSPDVSPGDKLGSGVWLDPIFPAPGAAVPGTWVQHNRGSMTQYTAFADDGNGVGLIQTGEVTVVPGDKRLRLKAFSTVTVAGLGVIAEVVSKGNAVNECPFDLP